MGMAILDTLIDKGQLVRTGAKQGEEGEWGDVLKVLTSGKVSQSVLGISVSFKISTHSLGTGDITPSHHISLYAAGHATDPSRPHSLPVRSDTSSSCTAIPDAELRLVI